jgi:hypothetical protein
MSCGSSASLPYSNRRPYMIAATKAAIPAFTCTTVPPAKSNAPNSRSQPPGAHTQCAIGAYTSNDHAPMNNRKVLNFALSANAPVISAGVITANIIWNTMNASCGIVDE